MVLKVEKQRDFIKKYDEIDYILVLNINIFE